MALSRDLALSDAERDDLPAQERNLRISTVSPSARINSTPLLFVWHDGKVWAYRRGQKVENLRRDRRCTVLVDRNERFAERQGVMIHGDAHIYENPAAEAAEPRCTRSASSTDASTPVATARGSHWGTRAEGGLGPRPHVALDRHHAHRQVTWDNNKL